MSNITRRKFLETSAKGVALASIPIVFQFNPMAAFAAADGKGMAIDDYYQHFGVDENLIREVMQEALSRGGDYCDLYFQHSVSSYIGLEDKAVNRAYTGVDFGVGIRVLKGDQTGFSFTEEITPKAMKLAARTAANIAADSPAAPPHAYKLVEPANYYHIQTPWEDVGIDKKIPYLNRVSEMLYAKDNDVVKTQVAFSDDTSFILFANSEGAVTYDYQPMTRLYCSCVVEKNGQRENGDFDYSARDGIEFYTPDKLSRMADKAYDKTMILFKSIKPEAGEMPVVLAAGSSGILLHEAIGHGMEADFNRKGESIFADKIGKPVAENFVSIVDNGTNAGMRGSINIDDEGNTSQETYLVRNGIMESYMHDRISSRFYNVKPTGSGRRESFRFPPLPRMRNTYMQPGPHTKDEIIASVKKGIIAETFTNGQVYIGPGDFSFYVKTGFLIEDGKIAAPIKDINIIGNGPDVLSKVVMVGDDLEFTEGGWTCGKGGQSVPVSMGLPTVKVSSITVGGMNS